MKESSFFLFLKYYRVSQYLVGAFPPIQNARFLFLLWRVHTKQNDSHFQKDSDSGHMPSTTKHCRYIVSLGQSKVSPSGSPYPMPPSSFSSQPSLSQISSQWQLALVPLELPQDTALPALPHPLSWHLYSGCGLALEVYTGQGQPETNFR